MDDDIGTEVDINGSVGGFEEALKLGDDVLAAKRGLENA